MHAGSRSRGSCSTAVGCRGEDHRSVARHRSCMRRASRSRRKDGRPLVVTVHDTLFLDYPEASPGPGSRVPPRDARSAERSRPRDRPVEGDGRCARGDRASSSARAHRPDGDRHGTATTRRAGADARTIEGATSVRAVDGHARTTKESRGRRSRFRASRSRRGLPDGDKLNLYMVGPPGWWSGDVRDLISSRGLGRTRAAHRRAADSGSRGALRGSVCLRVPFPGRRFRSARARGDGVRHTRRYIKPVLAAGGRRICRRALRSGQITNRSLHAICEDPSGRRHRRRLAAARASPGEASSPGTERRTKPSLATERRSRPSRRSRDAARCDRRDGDPGSARRSRCLRVRAPSSSRGYVRPSSTCSRTIVTSTS